MNKEQALYSFWSGFGIPAYDENSVPINNAKPPYITYETMTGAMDDILPMTASIWYRSPSWVEVSQKAHEIAARIGSAYSIITLDNGYLWITKGSPFTQRMGDENDPMIKRIIVNIIAEFLTAY